MAAPVGGLTKAPRFFGAVLVVLACVPALGYAYAVLSDLFRNTYYLGADPIKAAEHAFGLWTIRLLMATLCITPLRRVTGWHWLIKQRRTLGLFTFAYAVLHLLVWALLDVQIVVSDIVGWDTIAEDLTKRPFIMIGMLGLLLMVPLAVTSTQTMQARLGRRWAKLHRLVYVVAVLGSIHFWMSAKKDIREPLVYALLFAALLAWRWRDARRKAAERRVSAAGTAKA